MSDRDDAPVKAAEYLLRVRDVPVGGRRRRDVGTLDVEPGGVNVIPGTVRLTVDARARDDAALACCRASACRSRRGRLPWR